MSKPPVKQVKNIQEWLFDYLDTQIDPYDFNRYLPQWAKEAGVRLPDETYVEDLKPARLKKFKEWLIDREKGIDWVSTGDIYAPAYLYFNEVKKLPAGSWCIHFTNADGFEVFEQGTTLEGLALSTHKVNKDTVDCKKNLGDDIGSFDVVFGFAFEARERQAGSLRMDVMSHGLSKYGENAVLFQTDGGVQAWHVGDEEYQVIFPLCSEYNVIPMYHPDPVEIVIQTVGGGEETFASLEEVIAYIGGAQKDPSRRLVRMDGRLHS